MVYRIVFVSLFIIVLFLWLSQFILIINFLALELKFLA